MKTLAVLLLASTMALSASSCAGETDAGSKVLVLAAASLSDAFTAMETEFEAANPGIDVQLNFAGSSSLREQINEGAPADVFASANEAVMADVVASGAANDAPRLFAHNVLQLAVPLGNPGGITELADLTNAELAIGLCAVGVPCGDLAREALASAGVEASVDTNEPDVRALLSKLEADELDAGIVYRSDLVGMSGKIEGVEVAALSRTGTDYPIVVLSDSPEPADAQLFVDFVLSAEGQDIMAAFGFSNP